MYGVTPRERRNVSLEINSRLGKDFCNNLKECLRQRDAHMNADSCRCSFAGEKKHFLQVAQLSHSAPSAQRD